MPVRQQLPEEQYNLQSNYKKNNVIKFYVGSTSTTFKKRYKRHKASFNNKLNRHNTELSIYIWELKETILNYNLKEKYYAELKQNQKTTKHAIYVA